MNPKLITFDGITQSVTDWALDYGITPDTITRRLRAGWPVARAITTPIRSKPGDKLTGAYLDAALGVSKPKKPQPRQRRETDLYLTFDGEERSLHEWAKLTGIKYATLRHRLKKGWPVANILTEPVSKNSRRPGVVFDFAGDEGTGGGRSAQDRPEISFSPNEKVEA